MEKSRLRRADPSEFFIYAAVMLTRRAGSESGVVVSISLFGAVILSLTVWQYMRSAREISFGHLRVSQNVC
jgi:hypothetical protein